MCASYRTNTTDKCTLVGGGLTQLWTMLHSWVVVSSNNVCLSFSLQIQKHMFRQLYAFIRDKMFHSQRVYSLAEYPQKLTRRVECVHNKASLNPAWCLSLDLKILRMCWEVQLSAAAIIISIYQRVKLAVLGHSTSSDSIQFGSVAFVTPSGINVRWGGGYPVSDHISHTWSGHDLHCLLKKHK